MAKSQCYDCLVDKIWLLGFVTGYGDKTNVYPKSGFFKGEPK